MDCNMFINNFLENAKMNHKLSIQCLIVVLHYIISIYLLEYNNFPNLI